MSSVSNTPPNQPVHDTLPASLTLLLAASAGFGVAAVFYSQPLVEVLGADIGASVREIGFVPTLTQFGYAIGILLLAPLGDKYERRRIILIKAAVLVLGLLGATASSSIVPLLWASLMVGLGATVAQDVVPAAAVLASEAHRGKAVGTVMTGLLLGILLSRVMSGFVAERFGWRAVFVLAAASIAIIGLANARLLPRLYPTTKLGYFALLGTLGKLWQQHSAVRRASIAQALLSLGFGAFWSTLAVVLHEAPFHLGSGAAGAFGFAGAAGALAAPLAGRLADRRGPEIVIRLGAALVVVSFCAMLFAPLLTPASGVVLIAACAIGFDFGLQACLISHQTIVYGIDPAARSRLNAILVTGVFIGMSIGSALGSLVLPSWGWTGVALMSAASGVGALVVRMWPAPKTGSDGVGSTP